MIWLFIFISSVLSVVISVRLLQLSFFAANSNASVSRLNALWSVTLYATCINSNTMP